MVADIPKRYLTPSVTFDISEQRDDGEAQTCARGIQDILKNMVASEMINED